MGEDKEFRGQAYNGSQWMYRQPTTDLGQSSKWFVLLSTHGSFGFAFFKERVMHTCGFWHIYRSFLLGLLNVPHILLIFRIQAVGSQSLVRICLFADLLF